MKIFARSPFIIEVNEPLNTNSKIELFIWNGPTVPTLPQYILTKLIPATNVLSMTYNVSPYVREYFNFNVVGISAIVNGTNTSQYANVKIKRYANDVFIDEVDYVAFDGYGYYTDGFNPQLQDVLFEDGEYNYYYNGNPTDPTNYQAGVITVNADTGWSVNHTRLDTMTTINTPISQGVQNVGRVYPSLPYAVAGCKTEILNASLVVQGSFTFRPLEECKHTPVTIDFINRFGAWNRAYFFKANKESLEVENKEYNLLQSSLINFDIKEGQRKSFNTNGKESVTVNTGFVNESFTEIIRQLLLSERILLDGKPATIRTKQLEKQKHINKKLINYTLDFTYAFDVINSVV